MKSQLAEAFLNNFVRSPNNDLWHGIPIFLPRHELSVTFIKNGDLVGAKLTEDGNPLSFGGRIAGITPYHAAYRLRKKNEVVRARCKRVAMSLRASIKLRKLKKLFISLALNKLTNKTNQKGTTHV